MHGNLTELAAAAAAKQHPAPGMEQPFSKGQRAPALQPLVLRASPTSVCQPPAGVRAALG